MGNDTDFKGFHVTNIYDNARDIEFNKRRSTVSLNSLRRLEAIQLSNSWSSMCESVRVSSMYAMKFNSMYQVDNDN